MCLILGEVAVRNLTLVKINVEMSNRLALQPAAQVIGGAWFKFGRALAWI